MKSIRVFSCMVILLFACTLNTWGIDKTKNLKVLVDSVQSRVGKVGFLPVYKQLIELAKDLQDSSKIDFAYSSKVSHYYQLGEIDSLKIASYECMQWYEIRNNGIGRYQIWREYIQRLTEKGMQHQAIAETELLRKDAEGRENQYGLACSEMCIGYNHRVFSNNVKLCIDYYNSALKQFEASSYYEDAYVVYLNIIQIYLSRQEYVAAIETLARLERLDAIVKSKKIVINSNLFLRFYEFRVIATLASKGKKAAEKYIRETDQYYKENQNSATLDAWYGYKILCFRILHDWKGALAYVDSLQRYNRSIGTCYPANQLFKAQCLEELGQLKEACTAYVAYANLNDSVRTVEMDDQLSKYTVQFEVDKLKMDKLELNAKIKSQQLTMSLMGGSIILILLLILTYYYMRSLAMNKKLDVANKAVVKASRIKSSFIQHITHEIRTPLNAIVGFSSLLAEGGTDEEEGREYSKQINSSNAYLLDLVSNVIDIADMDSQTENVPKKPVDGNACCIASIEIIRPLLKEAVKLQFTPSPEPVTMQTVYPWVQRVLLVLLSNANKFMDEGTIRIICEEDKRCRVVRFIVEDTGLGINEQFKDAIFERFFKVDNFTPGTGLGLSIAHQIMEIVDGRIFLDVTYSGGARFVVEWPANSCR